MPWKKGKKHSEATKKKMAKSHSDPEKKALHKTYEQHTPKKYFLLEDLIKEANLKVPKDKGKRVCWFFETFLTHTNGRWAGKKFKLVPWQVEFLRKLFGTVEKKGKRKGLRQYKQAYLEIAKKNGKSEIAAGVALYLLTFDEEGGPEILLAASNREQAGIVYGVAAIMVENSPDFLDKCIQVYSSTKYLVYVKGNGSLRVVSGDSKGKHGSNISGLIFDELHEQPNRNLYDILTKGSGAARSQPLFLFLTTAGDSKTSICYEVHEYAKKIQGGIINDPTFLPVIYSLKDEKDWKNQETWKECNPSLGIIFDLDNLTQEYNKTLHLPGDEARFKQLRLNMWSEESATRWIEMEEWDKCKGELDPTLLLGKTCYGGMDLSATTDLTACTLAFPIEEKIFLRHFFWLPEENIKKKSIQDHVNYEEWARQGYLELCPGNTVDYSYIRKRLKEFREKYNFREISFDPYNATHFGTELQEDGFDVLFVRQGMISLSPPTKALEIDILHRNIVYDGNPIMRWCMENVRMHTDLNDNKRPVKDKSTGRIDGVLATIMAYDRVIRTRGPSVYETRGITVIDDDGSETEAPVQKVDIPNIDNSKIYCLRCEHDIEGREFCPQCGLKVSIGRV